MDAARWDRVQQVFHQVADLAGEERENELLRLCAGDSALADEVRALLAEDSGPSLLDGGVEKVAGGIIGAAPKQERRIGAYRLSRLLGEGGMGVVYLAGREDLGSQVAVKLLRDAWLSPARRERFTQEQRTLAQLNHPGIARLYDADTLEDGTPWFAMEYVEGEPITKFTAGLDTGARLRLFRAVCEAVRYAHQHAVIHRDLKPSNILVKADGAVRLLDFGIAKRLDDPDQAQRTRTGLHLMTPAYASPEQIRGEPAGMQTDVYSLGVILFELLAGRHPFDLSERTAGEVERLILESDAPKPSVLAGAAGGNWADLDVMCLTAMHKDPARRYPSVEALIRDLDHFLRNEPLEARPDTFSYRLSKFVARNRRAVWTAAAGAAALTAIVVFFTVRLAGARNLALAEAARTQRVQRFLLNLFEGGDKAAGPADGLRVVTLLERGVQDAKALSSEPEVQAEMFQTLGGIYRKLGKFDQSESLLRSALKLRAGSAVAAAGMVELSRLQIDQAKLADAEHTARKALDSATAALPAGHPGIAEAAAGLGRALEAKGDYAGAIAQYDAAVKAFSAHGETTAELAVTLNALADAHFYAGHYDISESINQRVLAMYRGLYGERHTMVANILINLGAIQFERGQYRQAESLYRQALELTEAFHGENHFETASALTMLGRSLVFQKRFGEAARSLKRALAIQELVNGPVHPRVASVLNELGNIAVAENRLDDAEGYHRRTLEIYRKIHGEKHYLTALGLSNVANVWMNRGELARAETMFRDVAARFTAALGPQHMNTGIARIKLGRALLRQQKYREAEQESLAGYKVLSAQANPSVSWLRSARGDLVQIYEKLNLPEEAARFRAEAPD
jgi:serine/threonine-protein kinase